MTIRFLLANKKTRLILLLTLCVSLSILLIGLFSYSQYKKALDTDLNTPNVELLQINMDVTNRAIREADTKAVDVSFQQGVIEYIRTSGELPAEKRKELQAYLQTLATKPDVHSIAVIRFGDRSVLSSQFGYAASWEHAPDTTWIATIGEIKSKPLLVKRRMYGAPAPAESGQTELLSLVRPIVQNGQVTGAVMVNMDYDRLFSKIYTHLTSYQYVYNLEGELVYPKLNAPIPPADMKEVIAALDVRPFAYVKVQGQDYMANQTFSDVTGWRMISLVPMEELLKNVKVARNIMLLFALISALVGCLAIYLYNYAAFRPLKRINQLLIPGQKTSRSGDLHELEPVIGKLVGDFHNKALVAERSLPELRSKYIQDILTRSIGSQEIRIKWEQYFQDWEEGPLAMLVVSIDRYGLFAAEYQEEDQMLLKYALNNVVLELLEPSWRAVSMPVEKDSLAVLVQAKEPDPEGAAGLLEQDALRVIRMVEQVLSMSVSVGIGSEARGILQVAHSYTDAKEALSYRLYDGYAKVREITSMDLHHVEGAAAVPQEAGWIAEVLNALRASDHEACLQWIGRWAEAARQNGVQPQRVYRAVDDLLEEMLRLIAAFNLTPPPELADYTRHQITTLMLADLEQLLGRLTGQITEELGQRKMTKEYQLVQSMIRYMEENLHSNIGLQDVADHVHLGISSVSTVFKEETGTTVYDYLTGLRIERACELLRTTGLKIAEIAQQVGYQNENSFIRAFRKAKSITPGKYRETHKSSDGYADPPKPRQISVSDDSPEE